MELEDVLCVLASLAKEGVARQDAQWLSEVFQIREEP